MALPRLSGTQQKVPKPKIPRAGVKPGSPRRAGDAVAKALGFVDSTEMRAAGIAPEGSLLKMKQGGLVGKKRINNKSTGRDYAHEYAVYQGTPEQLKHRSSRNKARRKMAALGKVKKGDGKDVDHVNSNPMTNVTTNLKALPKSRNRAKK